MSEMMSIREAYGRALVELGEENPDVVVLEADLGRSTHTFMFGERFPHRYFTMGIAEANMMGVAAGLAAAGLMPFASTFSVFASMRACEQVRNSIAYPKLNVKIVATNAGIEIGADGVTHQAIEDIAIMRAIPNMTVIAPSDPHSTRIMVRRASELVGPVYIRLGRQPAPALYPPDFDIAVGESSTIREGSDVSLVAVGNMVFRALRAAQILESAGIKARVLDMHTIKPIDAEAILEAAEETGCIVTAEDHNTLGGLGGAVAEVVTDGLPVPVVRVALQDVFAESGHPEELLEHYGLTTRHIVDAARRAIKRRDCADV